MRTSRHCLPCLMLLGLAATTPALAALGEPDSTIAADRQQLGASEDIVTPGAVYVHTMTTPAGTVVREYVGADGRVFAVSWQGPFKPDLRQLLGRHFASLESAPRTPGGAVDRGVHRLVQDDLVVESSGRPRAFFGRAWLRSMLPTGFDTATVH